MKRNYFLFLSFLFSLPFTLKAQDAVFETFGCFSKSINNNSEIGGGGGISGFIKEAGLGGRKKYSRRKSSSRDFIFFSAGFDFYCCALGRHTVKDLPLLAPGTGNAEARLTNYSYGLDGVLRLRIGRNSSTIQPLIEVFGGVRTLESHMSLIPNHYSKKNPGADTSLYDATGINWGINVGFLINLDDFFKINISGSWSNSMVPGKIIDLSTARNIGNSLDFTTKRSPFDMLQIRVGLVLVLKDGPSYGSGYSGSTWHGSGHCGGGGGSHISIHAH